MIAAREQTREAVLTVWMQRYEDQVVAGPEEHTGAIADAASDVWEPLLRDLVAAYIHVAANQKLPTIEHWEAFARAQEALGK